MPFFLILSLAIIWSTNINLYRWTDPAKDAYQAAVVILQKELTVDEYQSIWLRSHSSMEDVQQAVKGALEEYQTRSKASKVREWLANCSSRVMYYGGGYQ